MEWWRLGLDYLNALKWFVLAMTVVLVFRGKLREMLGEMRVLLQRAKSAELSAVGVTAKMQMEEAKKEIAEASKELVEKDKTVFEKAFDRLTPAEREVIRRYASDEDVVFTDYEDIRGAGRRLAYMEEPEQSDESLSKTVRPPGYAKAETLEKLVRMLQLESDADLDQQKAQLETIIRAAERLGRAQALAESTDPSRSPFIFGWRGTEKIRPEQTTRLTPYEMPDSDPLKE